MNKPKCPTVDEIKQDKEVLEALGRFGISGADFNRRNETENIIFDATVKLWEEWKKRKQGKVPQLVDIRTAVHMPVSTVKSAVDRMVFDGRMIKGGRGIYIPKIEG